ncbi:MAG: two-component system phosphate regulon sensor histidine kinase PhoR [Polaribacter sp.]|jgi:two-component system phosphate regulon sensor histidine kinase PhoR|tara:strand:+ start:1067 stop:2326 length:1260 start_codon:yes stop_codon:yes gene_type:complete
MRTEIWRVVLIGLSCCLFGWNLGFLSEFLLLGLFVYLFWTFRVSARVLVWIDKGMRGLPPEIDGLWGEITDTLNRQRRRHRRSQDKMRLTINRVTRVTEALDEGLLVLRSDRTLDWWNSSAKRLLALRTSDRGTSVMNLIRDPVFVAYINQDQYSGSIKLASNLQNDILLELTASYFGQSEIVLVIKDISHINKLETLRSEFVGNVSHELRTPLTVVRGYLETLQDISNGSALQMKAYDQMSEQVMRMQSLADDLITLSQLEEDLEPPTEPFDVVPLLEIIVGEAEALSEGQHVIAFEAQPVMVTANQKTIRGALGNIIFNAVKHNPNGAKINIRIIDEAEGTTISVADDGIGIDPMEIPRLTERFYRGDGSRNSQTGGSGLGLAIVKHAITQAGGTLTINSRLGKGAQFDVWLPDPKD